MKASRNSECSIPDTGPRDPARTFVAVRAMVPVTQNPPNSARSDVGHALRDQFRIRPVLPPGHAVRHHRRQQRLDRPQQRKARGPGQGRLHRLHRQARQGGRGQHPGQFAERAADGRHRQPQRRRQRRASADRNQHPRPMRPPPLHAQDHRDRRQRHRDARPGSPCRARPTSAASLAVSSAGSPPASVSPNSGRNWLAKMMTAIPAVKPTVTG